MELQLHEGVALLGIFLNALAFGVYAYYLLRKGIVSTAIGWFLSTVIAAEGACSHYFETQSFYQSGTYMVGAVCCFIVFVLTARGNSIAPTRKDYYTAGFALVVLAFGLIDNLYMMLALCFYYLATYSIFLGAIAGGRSQERLLPWVIWVGAALCHITTLALTVEGYAAFILPVTNLLCWGAASVLIMRRGRGE